MKNNLKPALCSLLVMMASGHANAAEVAASVMPTGMLNISGKIIDKGCTLQVKDMVIQLAPTTSRSYTAVGDMGPKSDPINLELTGCPANTALSFSVAGTAGQTTSSYSMATETTNAKGFDIFLYGPGDDTLLAPNTKKTLTTDSSGNFNGQMTARVVSYMTSPSVGLLDTVFTYTLAYN
ncbi:fimbrial protein [Pseudocitrobacter corydidari]|uniref:Type 1 fimbrial protein n=1 Tax=Pseudocitrobacter corydidari TaxID=2891570 RepID=A0ABY3S5E0_9ENTR|nr:hypothetical protein [Pseudocitrobacter corydidari]UGS41328.1 hypothetical protein G163CM_20300 [Pseudocitrobacter corydidari]